MREKLIAIPTTKKRLRELRKIWREYRETEKWKKSIDELYIFLSDKGVIDKDEIKPFNKENLKLVVIDFIS